MKNRKFSLYDIEQFLREAGAERVNEKAVMSLEQEMEDTVKELISEASLYANYAGRARLIKSSDIVLLHKNGMPSQGRYPITVGRKLVRKRAQRVNNHARAVEVALAQVERL